MAVIGKRPKSHNKPVKIANRPFYKGVSNESKENAAAPAVVIESDSAISPREQANRRFLSEVENIPDVITAKPYGGKTLAEQCIAVVVPAMRSAASRQVFELEGETLRTYPDSRLDVRVIGLKERGLDLSQLETIPAPAELGHAVSSNGKGG